jgi:putative nucleotidyltransferase with HDIG domain
MQSYGFNAGVVITGGILLTITVVSVYVSRVMLPARIRSAYMKSITVLAAAVETKDSGTVGHAQRVADLTVEVAKRLGSGARALEHMRYAALLMDMGKANVPQSLLNKTEPLTPQEWEIMKSHPRLGAEMVSAVPYLSHLCDIVLHHHEYWDGTGYPSGLAGEDIPLASRILCVAADYDAITSLRPYHTSPLTPEQAVEEIRKGIGVKYDPRVAEVFLDMLASDHGIHERARAA